MLRLRHRFFSVIVFTFVFVYTASAQIVDVESTTEGVIFPRVTSTANISSPSEGMLVYQTGNPEGFYYHDGSTWNLLSTGSTGGSGEVRVDLLDSRGFISGANDDRWAILGSGNSGSESGAQYHIPRGGTLKNLTVKPLSSLTSGSSVTITVRINGANTALAVTFTSADGINVKKDADEVAVNEGDLIAIRYQETGGVAQSGGNKFFSTFVELE